MTRDQVTHELQELFRDIFDEPTLEIFDAMTAADVDEWDSLTHINLVVASEKHFRVRFTTGEIHGLKNVGEFITLILSKL